MMETSSPDNISDLIAKPQEEYPPEPRYVSKYREKIVEASKRGKSAHRTMGVPPMDPEMPAQYLKQRSATEARWKALSSKPSKSPEREKRSSRREQKVLPPKKPPKARKISRPNRAKRGLWCVDDRHGNSYPVMLSGMFPVYRNREGFGKVPGTYAAPLKSEKRNTLEEIPSVEVVERRKSPKVDKSPRGGRSPGRTTQQQLKKKEVRRATKARERSPKARERSPKARQSRNNKRIQEPTRKLRKKEQSPKRSMVQKGGGRHSEGKKEKERPEAGRRETVHRKINEKNVEDDENEEEERSLQHQDDRESDQSSRKKEKEHGKDEGSEKRDESTSSESEVESKGTRASEGNSDDTTASSGGSSKSQNSASSTTTASTVSYHQPRCRYVDEDERAELLYGMKKKWDEMMKKFQCLPFVTDTQPKKKRKSQMEKELLQLEKDIKMIEAHPYIYVYSDPED